MKNERVDEEIIHKEKRFICCLIRYGRKLTFKIDIYFWKYETKIDVRWDIT